jgi:hypothetical protein
MEAIPHVTALHRHKEPSGVDRRAGTIVKVKTEADISHGDGTTTLDGTLEFTS